MSLFSKTDHFKLHSSYLKNVILFGLVRGVFLPYQVSVRYLSLTLGGRILYSRYPTLVNAFALNILPLYELLHDAHMNHINLSGNLHCHSVLILKRMRYANLSRKKSTCAENVNFALWQCCELL